MSPDLPSSGVRPHRGAVVAAVAVAIVALVSGCATTATPSGSPGQAGASPSAAPTSSSAAVPSSGGSPSAGPSLSSSPPPVDPAGPWHVAGATAAERDWQAAVTLANGEVLLIGTDRDRYDAQSELIPIEADTVELWNPSTETWRATRGLSKRRFEPALVALQDGRALVIGGYNEDDASYSSAYAFDSATESWSKVGLLSVARAAPSAAVLDDGRVLVAGGYYREPPHYDEGFVAVGETQLAAYRAGQADAPVTLDAGARTADIDPPDIGYAFATAELFDPATGTWSPTGSMRYARAGAAAVTLFDGRVLIVGSGDLGGVADIDGRAFETAEIYDPETGRFSLTGVLPAFDRAAIEDAGVPLPDSDPEPADVGRLVAIDDGGAMLVGHGVWWKHQGEVTRTLRFDSDQGTWQEAKPAEAWAYDEMRTEEHRTNGDARLSAFVAALPEGETLVAGGQAAYQSAGGIRSTAEIFDVYSETWTAVAAMPEARTNGVAVSLGDGSALLIGGHNDNEEYEQTFGVYSFRFVPGS